MCEARHTGTLKSETSTSKLDVSSALVTSGIYGAGAVVTCKSTCIANMHCHTYQKTIEYKGIRVRVGIEESD